MVRYFAFALLAVAVSSASAAGVPSSGPYAWRGLMLDESRFFFGT